MPGLNGLVVMKPTSIASTGTGNSSSIGANGKVTFSSCQTLSLNGVFSSAYDNYMIVMGDLSGSNQSVDIRLRASGTDNSTASSYTRQFLFGTGTSVSGARVSDSSTPFFTGSTPARSGCIGYLFGPFLAQPTAGRSVCCYGATDGTVLDYAFTHNQTTSYDGITFIANAGASGLMTGIVTVYGFNQ